MFIMLHVSAPNGQQQKNNLNLQLSTSEKNAFSMEKHACLWNQVVDIENDGEDLYKKNVRIGDTELICNRVIGLQHYSRDLNIKDVLTYELSLVPFALFDV